MDGCCVWGEVSLEAIACGLLLWLDWWVLCVEAVGELKLTFLFFPWGLCGNWWAGGVKQALISLSDKRDVEVLAKGLTELG